MMFGSGLDFISERWLGEGRYTGSYNYGSYGNQHPHPMQSQYPALPHDTAISGPLHYAPYHRSSAQPHFPDGTLFDEQYSQTASYPSHSPLARGALRQHVLHKPVCAFHEAKRVIINKGLKPIEQVTSGTLQGRKCVPPFHSTTKTLEKKAASDEGKRPLGLLSRAQATPTSLPLCRLPF
ncbi:hypothetical protein H8959_015911 [Pygathrix nigripes]